MKFKDWVEAPREGVSLTECIIDVKWVKYIFDTVAGKCIVKLNRRPVPIPAGLARDQINRALDRKLACAETPPVVLAKPEEQQEA